MSGMRRYAWMFALLGGAGCSFSPAGLAPGQAGDSGRPLDASLVDGGPPIDVVVPVDAPPIDAPPIDAAPQGSCVGKSDGTRLCDGNFVAHCTGAQVVHERPCPVESVCLNAECAVSPWQSACSATAQCTGAELCTPFVTHPLLITTSVELHCATPDSAAGPADTRAVCTSGTQCKTGICADDGYCFGACRTTNDCGSAAGMSVDCHAIAVHVDGQAAIVLGCGPML